MSTLGVIKVPAVRGCSGNTFGVLETPCSFVTPMGLLIAPTQKSTEVQIMILHLPGHSPPPAPLRSISASEQPCRSLKEHQTNASCEPGCVVKDICLRGPSSDAHISYLVYCINSGE